VVTGKFDQSLHRRKVSGVLQKGPASIARRSRPGFPAGVQWLQAAALVAAVLVGALAHAADERKTEADLDKVRADIAELQKSIRTETTERDALAARLRDAEVTVAGARKRLDQVRAQRRQSTQRRAALQAQRTSVEQTLGEEREALAGQLRAAYTIGRDEQLKLLLNQQDPAQLGRMLAYYGYFGRARADRIAAIDSQLAKLVELDAELVAQDEQLAALEREAQVQLDNVQRGRRDRAAVVKELDQELKNRRVQLARLKREESTLENLLTDLRRVMQEFPVNSEEPFEKLKGKLAWPVLGRLVADFGQKRSPGLKWNGVLLATERGTQVRALYFGRVIYADWLPGMGLLTILEHSGGYLSLYGHNQQLFKAVGDWVSPGDVIATAGDSGGRSRPELYFEIRKGSTPLNPHQWIRKPLPRG
jgi:septal ring factor EnvC (AmiA/AmiB activator)